MSSDPSNCLTSPSRAVAGQGRVLYVVHRGLRLVRQPRGLLRECLRWLTGRGGARVETSSPAAEVRIPERLLDRAGVPHVPSHRAFRVLFVLRPGRVDAASMRYRAFNLIEALRLVGIEAAYLSDQHIRQQLAAALSYDLIVLVRRKLTAEVALLLDAAEKHAVPVVNDLDDYLFDDEVIPHVEMLCNLPREEARGMVDEWRAVLERCCAYIGTTSYLRERAAALGKRSYLIRNGLNQAQLDLSRRALAQVREPGARAGLCLGYFSGTRTHQHDFRLIAGVLVRLLSEFPSLGLIVAGDFDLEEFPEFRRFGDRVEGRPFVDWRLLPAEIARADINLIPLEINRFTEAKSDLKYYEAALLKIPSVASPTRVYTECISHGANGFLARSEQAWYEILRTLILDPELRKQVGERAHRHVLATYVPRVVADEAVSIYRQLLLLRRRDLGVADDAPTVVVLVSDLLRALRDRTVALPLARAIARAGARVTLLLAEGPAGFTAAHAWDWINESIGEPPFTIQVGGMVPCCDLLLATDASTAHQAKQAAHRVGWTVYVVSEYEPAHLPVGEARERALASYHLGLDLWVLDPAVGDLLSWHHDGQANLLPSWVEARPTAARTGDARRMVLIAATSSVPDHAWDEVVAALKRIEAVHANLSIVLCGDASPRAAAAGLPYRHHPLLDGVWFEAFLAERPLCVAIYATGRPLWVHDLMAAGCPVIAVASCLRDSLAAPERADGLIAVHAEAGAIAEAVDALLLDWVRLDGLTARGAFRVAVMPAAEEAARTLLRAYDEALSPEVPQGDETVVRVA